MVFVPCLVRSETGAPRLGEPLLDEYLRFVAARARPNTVLAQSFDLKVFFTVIGTAPTQVRTGDVLRFIEAQREPRNGNAVRLVDGEAGNGRVDDQAAAGQLVGPVRLSDRPRVGGQEPGAAEPVGPSGPGAVAGQPAGAGAATAATDPRRGRGRTAGRSLAH
jgi:hypothetical protein